MTMLEAIQYLDCDVNKVVEALESGAIHLSGNFKGQEDEVARQAKISDDAPVFDSSMWAAFGD